MKINSRGNDCGKVLKEVSPVRRSADIFFVATFLCYSFADEQFTGKFAAAYFKRTFDLTGRDFSAASLLFAHVAFSTTVDQFRPAISDNSVVILSLS